MASLTKLKHGSVESLQQNSSRLGEANWEVAEEQVRREIERRNNMAKRSRVRSERRQREKQATLMKERQKEEARCSYVQETSLRTLGSVTSKYNRAYFPYNESPRADRASSGIRSPRLAVGSSEYEGAVGKGRFNLHSLQSSLMSHLITRSDGDPVSYDKPRKFENDTMCVFASPDFFGEKIGGVREDPLFLAGSKGPMSKGKLFKLRPSCDSSARSSGNNQSN